MNNGLIILVVLLVLAGCAPTYKVVSISEDDTAEIKSSLLFPELDSLTETYSYENIQHISDLDSLGQYLKMSNEDFCEVKYDASTFEFVALNSVKCDSSFFYSVPGYIHWKFPKKVIDIQGNGEIDLHRNMRELFIHNTKENYCSQDNLLNVSVTFGADSIQSKVEHPFSLKRTGIAIDILPGFGFGQIHGESGDSLDAGLFMNWGFSVILNRTRLIARLSLLDGQIVGNEGFGGFSNFENTSLEFGLGQELVEHPLFNLVPVVYLGKSKLEYYDDELEETLPLSRGIQYAVGATLELKVNQMFRSRQKRIEKRGETLYLKLDGGWYPDYFQESLSMKGSVSYFTFAIGGYLAGDNSFRRVKFRNE